MAEIGIGLAVYLIGAFVLSYIAGRRGENDWSAQIVIWPAWLIIIPATAIVYAPILIACWFYNLGSAQRGQP